MKSLARAYLAKGIVPQRYYEDALHIAIATILEVDYLVSWNMKHIVNKNNMIQFNKINQKMGYKPIKIVKPEEVMKHE